MPDGGGLPITRADAERLASKLDAIIEELPEPERNVLSVILARAATASVSEDVEGFAFEAHVNIKGVKQGQFKGQISQAAGFGPGVDVIEVQLDYPGRLA
jgi:hypothetical protein